MKLRPQRNTIDKSKLNSAVRACCATALRRRLRKCNCWIRALASAVKLSLNLLYGLACRTLKSSRLTISLRPTDDLLHCLKAHQCFRKVLSCDSRPVRFTSAATRLPDVESSGGRLRFMGRSDECAERCRLYLHT